MRVLIALSAPAGRSVFLSTCPADDFGAFTEPKLMIKADEVDWQNARERVSSGA